MRLVARRSTETGLAAGGCPALNERLARLLADTSPQLLPTVCYLCQGLIAPEFAGADLGLAEKLAIRALATVAGTDAARVAALVREDVLTCTGVLLLPGQRHFPGLWWLATTGRHVGFESWKRHEHEAMDQELLALVRRDLRLLKGQI